MKLSKYTRYIVFGVILIIVITTLNLFNWYLSSVTPKINQIVVAKLEKLTYEIITDKINTDLINENNLKDVLIITKNDDGEILTVDYNLEKAYTVNNKINASIISSITNLSNGDLLNDEFYISDNGIYIKEPLFINSGYVIISSWGPQIPIKVDFIDTVVTNLKTKITSYGLNNVLSELYVTVEITQLITTPVTSQEIYLSYDILIDATMINGRVPAYYGSEYITNSPLIDTEIS